MPYSVVSPATNSVLYENLGNFSQYSVLFILLYISSGELFLCFKVLGSKPFRAAKTFIIARPSLVIVVNVVTDLIR